MQIHPKMMMTQKWRCLQEDPKNEDYSINEDEQKIWDGPNHEYDPENEILFSTTSSNIFSFNFCIMFQTTGDTYLQFTVTAN